MAGRRLLGFFPRLLGSLLPLALVGFGSLVYSMVPTPNSVDLVITQAEVFAPYRVANGPAKNMLVVSGGRIVALGDSADPALVYHLRGSRRVITGGATPISVLPGLQDAHAHLLGLGLSLSILDLRGRSLAEIANLVKSCGGTGVCQGRGWDQVHFPKQAMPHRQVLDAVAPSRPVWLRRVDGHAGWANSAALQLAGLTRKTPDPQGGRLLRDNKGELTGVLIDSAMDLVEKALPAPSKEQIRQAIRKGAAHAVARGLTGVAEMGLSRDAIAVYRELAAKGELPLRVYGYAADPIGTETPGSKEYEAVLASLLPLFQTADKGHFRLVGIKLFADGALGSRGAALLAPYADDPRNTGLLLSSPEHLLAMASFAIKNRLQLATHAIGDRANRMVLDAYERAGVTRQKDLRFRIEHAQVIDPSDIPRFAALGVIASIQPTHATSDMRWAADRLSRQRLKGAYAYQSLLASKAMLAAGSDFPVEEVDPLYGLHAAITRMDHKGKPKGGFLPEQRLNLEQAVAAFSKGAAHAVFAEPALGSIIASGPADLTVIEGALGDPKGYPQDLYKRKVLLTVVGGEVVYDGTTSKGKE